MASGNKIVIAFFSVSTEKSTDQLFEQIKRENEDFRCVFVKLTHQDLQSFQPGETYDAVVLLHSISQGRNSITDVADAKYSKLLPKLKTIYGPDRVAVVVHSMTSFNSSTKMALMMVFKKSQPTTFKCSNCVIQCNNLAEMRAEDLSRLTEFLGKVPDHPLPVAEDEAFSTLITTPFADENDKIGTGHNPQSTPASGAKSVTKEQITASSALGSTDTSSMSQTEVGRSGKYSAFSSDKGSSVDPVGVDRGSDDAPSQPSNNQNSMTSTSTTGRGDDNVQNMGKSQLGAFYPDPPDISKASSKGVPSPDAIGVGRLNTYSSFLSDKGSSVDPSGADRGLDDAATQASNIQNVMTMPSTIGMGDGNLQNMSQLGATVTTADTSQAPLEFDTSPDRDATQDKLIDTSYPIALFSLFTSNQCKHLLEGLRRQFPVKSITLITDVRDLATKWHLFEAILVDLGSLQEAASYSSDEYKGAFDIYQNLLKEMLVPQNVAVLMLAPANTPTDHERASDFMSLISEISKTTKVFQYCSESCRPSLFDDNTNNRLVFWLLDCYKRYHAAVNQEGLGFSEGIGASPSDNPQDSQASSTFGTSPEGHPTQDKPINPTYPIALFSLSSSGQSEMLKDWLQQQLPGKTIMLIKEKHMLTSNCHLFEAILVDLGSLQEAASCSSNEYKDAFDIYQKCLKKMLEPQNLALLMLAPANTHSADKHAGNMSLITEISKTTDVFQYGSESCRLSLFDDNTTNRLVFWLFHCYPRYHAAILRKGPGTLKILQTQLARFFPSFFRKLGR